MNSCFLSIEIIFSKQKTFCIAFKKQFQLIQFLKKKTLITCSKIFKS